MAPTKKTASSALKAKAAHPSFQEMIKECVQSSTEDSRHGVSRPQIKKFLADKFKVDMSSQSNTTHLNKAIAKGAESGIFELPKGIGGRVKLVKKVKASTNNKESEPLQNAPPAKKAPVAAKKPVAAKEAPKKAAPTKAAPKKAAAKPAAAPKKAAPAKKTAAASKPKTAATGKTATKTATKAAPKKRAAAKK
ncbi:hypothetical protein QFC19_002729 [Naganishia cerealis]|uniref:Uncharacterized protein n=1 Tax=Naganishia cerealis TaxID=610337 RepID=A0ACC2W8S6_9TREE|nr:hypothetical protein QFC19_002729 [Naganishia cerealis]